MNVGTDFRLKSFLELLRIESTFSIGTIRARMTAWGDFFFFVEGNFFVGIWRTLGFKRKTRCRYKGHYRNGVVYAESLGPSLTVEARRLRGCRFASSKRTISSVNSINRFGSGSLAASSTEFHPLLYIFLHAPPSCGCPSVVKSSLRLCNSAFSSASFFGSLTIVIRGKTSFHEIWRGVNRRHVRSLADNRGPIPGAYANH